MRQPVAPPCGRAITAVRSPSRPSWSRSCPRCRARFSETLKRAIIVGHNLPVDLESLIRNKSKGLTVALEQWLQGRRQRDTVLEARLSDENRGKHGYKLETLTTALFNTPDWKKATEDLGPDPAKWPPHLRDERCRIDAWATLKIHKVLEETVEGPSRLSHAIAMSLRRMYWAGVFIDPSKFKTMRNLVHKERAKAFSDVLKFATKFGMAEGFTAKDEQLREYVYGRNGVGLEIESYTKGGLPSRAHSFSHRNAPPCC